MLGTAMAMTKVNFYTLLCILNTALRCRSVRHKGLFILVSYWDLRYLILLITETYRSSKAETFQRLEVLKLQVCAQNSITSRLNLLLGVGGNPEILNLCHLIRVLFSYLRMIQLIGVMKGESMQGEEMMDYKLCKRKT